MPARRVTFPCLSRRMSRWPGILALLALPVFCPPSPPAQAATAGTTIAERASKHWAFQPVRKPALPAVVDASRIQTPVDRFIQAELERHGMGLAEPAASHAIIRRLAMAMTGLPPGPSDVPDSDRPPGPDAFSPWIERHLASFHFGERWAKHWLDAAGYADSNGYFSADSDRPLAYRYRDYVIRSINRDKPFDQFVREQLAGDELADWTPGTPATPEIIEWLEATHFLRNGQDGTGESDGNPDEVRTDRYYALESAMQIAGSSLLGLTLQCAKCHDHKFEPLTQRDYYGFQAVLYPAFPIERWSKPADRVVVAPLPGETERWQEREVVLDREASVLRAGFEGWLHNRRPIARILFEDAFNPGSSLAPRWSNTAPGDDKPAGSPAVRLDTNAAPAALAKDGVLRILEGGGSGDRWLCTAESFNWRPERKGDWIQATFDLVDLRTATNGSPAERIGFLIAAHDFDDSSATPGGNILLDGNPQGGAQVHLDYPGPDASGLGKLGADPYKAGRNYGVRVTNAGTNDFLLEHLVDGVPEGRSIHLKSEDLPPGAFAFEYCCGRSFIVDNVRVETTPVNDGGTFAAADDAFRKEYATRRKSFDESLKQIDTRRLPKPGRVAWVSDASPEPPVVHLLNRGNHKTPGDVVEPSSFSFIQSHRVQFTPPGKGGRSTGRRLAWARWLTEPGTPQAGLLARVAVNRVWQHYFGKGLVETSDNLGLSGAQPSHRDLIEWLAAELIENGWHLKPIHRLIAASAAFQQSSRATARGLEADPADRLLWRFPVRRLDAEAIRDSMIAIAGKLGGKTSGPYVPTLRNGAGETVVDEALPDATARSIYLQQRRSQVPTLLNVFDAPSLVFNCSRRAETTMPLQSLSLLNSEFAIQRASDMAGRLAAEAGPDVNARLDLAFRLVAGRGPNPDERRASIEFIETQRKLYLASDASQAGRKSWADLCQMLLGSSAFLYVD